MMLILAFFALVIACVLLWLELTSYNDGKYPYWKTSSIGAPRPVPMLAAYRLTDAGRPAV